MNNNLTVGVNIGNQLTLDAVDAAAPNTHTEWHFTQTIGGSVVILSMQVELAGFRDSKQMVSVHCRPLYIDDKEVGETMLTPDMRLHLIEFLNRDEHDLAAYCQQVGKLELSSISDRMDTTLMFTESFQVNNHNPKFVIQQIEGGIKKLFNAVPVQVEDEKPGTLVAPVPSRSISTKYLVPSEHTHLFNAAADQAFKKYPDVPKTEVELLLLRGMQLQKKNVLELMTAAQEAGNRYPQVEPATVSALLLDGKTLGEEMAMLTANASQMLR